MKRINGSQSGFPSVLPNSHRCFHVLIASALTLASFSTSAFGQSPPSVAPRSRRSDYPPPTSLFSPEIVAATQGNISESAFAAPDEVSNAFASQPLLLQTVVSQTFVGIDAGATPNTAPQPPDPNCAVSSDRIIQVTNRGVAAFNKTGGTMWALVDLATFFPNSLTGSHFTDPKVMWDRINSRFYVVALEIPNVSPGQPVLDSFVHIAVSTDATPDGGTVADWRFVARQVQQLVPDPLNPGQNFSYAADYPSIGMDNTRLFVTFNMFREAPQPATFDHVQIMIWQKAPLLLPEGMPPNPLAVPVVIVRNTTAASGALSLVPASVVGPISPGNIPAAPGEFAYFVEVHYFSNTAVRLWVIRDPSGVATAPAFFSITVPTNGGQVFDAPQPQLCCNPPGSGIPFTLYLDTVSDEGAMDRAYWHRGTLWVSTTRGGINATGTVFYYAINTNNFPFANPALAEIGSIPESHD